MLPKNKLAKFQKEYKTFSKTKKRTLLESIRIAREMLENKGKLDEDKFEKLKKSSDNSEKNPTARNDNNINKIPEEKKSKNISNNNINTYISILR
jgi:hypothetical protein